MRYDARGSDHFNGAHRSYSNANQKNAAGPLGQDICHALGVRLKEFSISISRWKAHRLGLLHYQQSACHPPSFQLGHDLCLCTLRQLRGLWWARQYLFHLQVLELNLPFGKMGVVLNISEVLSSDRIEFGLIIKGCVGTFQFEDKGR